MGCSSSNRRLIREENEFYLEAMGYKTKRPKGLFVDENLDSVKTMKPLNSYFCEEITEHADESGVVKPWLTNVIAPDHDVEEDLTLPKYTLKLEHIFGFRVENSRQNLYYFNKDELIYISSSLGIIQNIDDLSQRLFGGFQAKEERECHDNDIISLAFYKGDVSMAATGQRGMKPKILVWSPLDPSVVYAKFSQPKGSKEVSALAFDSNGRYLASIGKDERNTFYVFDMQTKSCFWASETDDEKGEVNEFLLDLKFNPRKDELCLVGVNKVIFAFVGRKTLQNKYKPEEGDDELMIFTCTCYLSDGTCLIGNDKGVMYVYKDIKKLLEISISSSSIQNITYSQRFNKIYVTDAMGSVYILNDTDYKKIDKFKMESIVKSLDVNEDEDIVMGLKNGEIIIKHYREPSKREVSFLKSHSEGSIGGLDFIPDNRVITSGDDNKILLFNLRSKKCEAEGIINLVLPNPYAQNPSELYAFQDRNKSKALSYNLQKDHVAVGVNNGTVSIREGMKKLNNRLFDISIGKGAISELKYTKYGDMLIACSVSGEISMMNANNNYDIEAKTSLLNNYVICFDWDINNRFIQCVTSSNQLLFFGLESEKEKELKEINDPMDVQSVEWPNLTCKFGYTVQGVYMGSTDPDFITCVCKANTKKIILSGDDDLLLNLYNYPTVCENPKVRSFRGHSGHIKRIVFSNDDEKVITIAKDDKSVILWSMVQA